MRRLSIHVKKSFSRLSHVLYGVAAISALALIVELTFSAPRVSHAKSEPAVVYLPDRNDSSIATSCLTAEPWRLGFETQSVLDTQSYLLSHLLFRYALRS